MKFTTGTFRQDLLASLVVFLVALPLCLGIAIASGAPPAAGLITGIIGGLVAGSMAGCPLQVSGPAAGLAVIVYEIVEKYGMKGVAVVVFFAGLVQVLAGALRLGQYFRAMSPSVVYGMLAGMGPQEALNHGWAHGALLTTFPGDTTMATLKQVSDLAKGGSARVQR